MYMAGGETGGTKISLDFYNTIFQVAALVRMTSPWRHHENHRGVGTEISLGFDNAVFQGTVFRGGRDVQRDVTTRPRRVRVASRPPAPRARALSLSLSAAAARSSLRRDGYSTHAWTDFQRRSCTLLTRKERRCRVQSWMHTHRVAMSS